MNNVESPLKNIVENLKDNELWANILDGIIWASDVEWLKQIEKEIEQDKTIKWLDKIMKKIAINIKGNVFFWDERKNLSRKEKKEYKEEQSKKDTKEDTKIIIEPYDTKKWLMFIDKVKDNQEPFDKKVKEISDKLDINPNRLMQIMNKESGLDSKAVNKDTQATGLIQFMPDTAKWLGTTVAQLKNMSNVEQLDYVYKYYEKFWNKIHSYTDLYLATFYPVAIGKPDSYVIWSENGRQAIIGKQNKMNNWNPISVSHIKTRLSKWIPDNYIAQFQWSPEKNEEIPQNKIRAKTIQEAVIVWDSHVWWVKTMWWFAWDSYNYNGYDTGQLFEKIKQWDISLWNKKSLILYTGSNDISKNKLWQMRQSLENIQKYLKNEWVQLVVSTIPSNKWKTESDINKANDIIKEFADNNKLPIIDVNKNIQIETNEYQADNIHFNKSGYTKIADYLENQFT